VLNAAEIKPAIEAFAGKPDGAMIVLPDYMLDDQRQHVVALAATHRIPDLYAGNEASGGLLFYSSDWTDLHRRAASYVDKILKGAKPAELPIQQPTKFQLVINLETAKMPRLNVPPSLIARADEVIE
jgi:putative ABC transport system substrate-binding protein